MFTDSTFVKLALNSRQKQHCKLILRKDFASACFAKFIILLYILFAINIVRLFYYTRLFFCTSTSARIIILYNNVKIALFLNDMILRALRYSVIV